MLPRRQFSAWPSLLYLNGMKEEFLSLFLSWRIQSSFCSWGHLVRRKICLKNIKIASQFLAIIEIRIKCFNSFWASMLPGFSSRGGKVLKKELFWEFQDGCSARPSLISVWNDLSNSWPLFCLDATHQVSAQENIWFGRRYCLKYWRRLPWWQNTMVLPAVSLQSPV